MVAWESLGDIHLLVVEDDSFSILLIRNILREISQIHFYEASDGIEALEVLSNHPIDVILLDYHMPRMNGYETLIEIRKNKRYDKIVVLPITTDDEEKKKFYLQGANDFISKPFKIEELESKIYHNLRAVTEEQNAPSVPKEKEIFNEKEIEKNQKTFFRTLVTSRAKSHLEKRTSLSIASLSRAFALKLGYTETEAANIAYGALIRDIGFFNIKESQKPKDANAFIQYILRGHKMLDGSINTRFIQTARTIILEHYEYYDGSGLPYGLTGDTISKEAQLVAIAERFETLLSQGSREDYSRTPEEVYKILHSQSSKQFNPELLAVFLEHFADFITLRHKLLDSSK